ncbi:MAG: hypothetical protein Q4A17_04885 [Thermoguttaceae bacterium]|nr:hypothetical protein [Thermoguttaceae bacterium]
MKNEKSNKPFWIEHPEYYPDGPNTHLKKKPQFKLYKNKFFSMHTLKTLKSYTIGCACSLLVLLLIIMVLVGIFLILGKIATVIGLKWKHIPFILLFGWLLMKGRQKIISDGVKDALKETEEEHRNR